MASSRQIFSGRPEFSHVVGQPQVTEVWGKQEQKYIHTFINFIIKTKILHHKQKEIMSGFHTADFMKKVPRVYTHSMETIYPSMSEQVAECLGNCFQEIPGISIFLV